jgi:hypothetical protein
MIESVPTLREGTLALDEGTRLRAGPAVSWGAIFAGAVVAVATSLILLALGAGLGYASMSVWPGLGAAGSSFTIAGVIWLIVTQWFSAAIGGYIAGRLRHRWLATHVHEVFFRDTAHGLVTWAVATLAVAAVTAGSLSSLVAGATRSTTLMTDAHVAGSTASEAAIYTALAMLIGAFIASVAAAIGGRLRDEHL